jgi:hypothetical protein
MRRLHRPIQAIQPFVLALRYHLGMAYYSAPAIKSAYAYTGPPQPDGFADFRERPASAARAIGM